MSGSIVRKYTIKKTMLGAFQVEFNCPYCGAELRSKESEISEKDWCPECRQPFQISPKAISEIESQREGEQADKERKAEEKREKSQQRRREAEERKRLKREELEKRRSSQESEAVFEKTPEKTIIPPPRKQNPAITEEQVYLKSCPFCKSDISTDAIKCRHCGEFVDGRLTNQNQHPPKKPRVQTPHGYPKTNQSNNSAGKFLLIVLGISGGAMALFGLCCIGILFSPSITSPTKSTFQDRATNNGISSRTSSREWYEGGNLHRKSALDWQNASHENKLATCADFVAGSWQNNELAPRIQNSISNIEDMYPYAQELVNFIDSATERDPNPQKNRQMYANQKVAQMAATGMILMKWLK